MQGQQLTLVRTAQEGDGGFVAVEDAVLAEQHVGVRGTLEEQAESLFRGDALGDVHYRPHHAHYCICRIHNGTTDDMAPAGRSTGQEQAHVTLVWLPP